MVVSTSNIIRGRRLISIEVCVKLVCLACNLNFVLIIVAYIKFELTCIDFTAILVITNCRNTWQVYNAARKEILLLIALTDADCPRLPLREAVTV